MMFSVYAVRDSLLGFGMPLLRDNDAVASRSFEYDINHTDVYNTRPQDYQYYRIGMFNTETGELVPESPTLIASAIDFIKEK